ncbi:MAG TPA: hypothetical protein VJ201_08940 [Candidatus Babeliales bacterium]|nr:hypothetical protein [Candidatus Babeliales bacterium]
MGIGKPRLSELKRNKKADNFLDGEIFIQNGPVYLDQKRASVYRKLNISLAYNIEAEQNVETLQLIPSDEEALDEICKRIKEALKNIVGW